ncbi:MAG TPA: endonuclease/exonuclease/phosphatase family protein [Planctomycetota bacterium]|nr:endonuclease/exonuclease/phosphatase family protein [Planctomycetota bacterium]
MRNSRLLRLALLATAGIALASSTSAADRRGDPLQLSIATFNARFLFDGHPPEGEAGFPWKNDPAKARRHVQEIAAILREVNADIVHISEVEDHETLKRLLLEIGDPTYRAFLVPGRDAFTRQNVGLISRIDPDAPLRRTDEWASGPGGGPRQGVPKNYAARITAGSLRLTLVGLHLLAFPDDPERAPRREAQAEVARRFAGEEGTSAGRLVIVLGDLNDVDPEVLDTAGSTAITSVLEILRAVDPRVPEDDLMNPAALLAEEDRFTAFVDRNQNGLDDGLAERTLTDHILLPEALAPAILQVEVYPGHDPLGPSDHFPLKVTLDLSSEVFVRGDADRDARTSEKDALAILAHLFEGRRLACEDAADVDDDGRITLTDAVYLLSHLHRQDLPPPPPGPRLPGIDPTPDALEECRSAPLP